MNAFYPKDGGPAFPFACQGPEVYYGLSMRDFPTWAPYAEGATTLESIPLECVEMMVKNQRAVKLALADAKGGVA